MVEQLRQEIEQMFGLKIVDEQYYDWGESYWLQLDPNARRFSRSVSIVNIYPAAEQKKHTHPGYEEIIFGLDGESIHWANGHRIELGQGKVGFIPADGEHRIINASGQIARMISIIYPVLPVDLGEISNICNIDLREVSRLINLEAISEKFSKSLCLAVTLVDQEGKLLTPKENLPDLCNLCLRNKTGNCLINHSNCCVADGQALTIFRCALGVCAIQSPIMINKRILGYLGCGYGRIILPSVDEQAELKAVFASADLVRAQKAFFNMDMINRNHLQSAGETLSLIGASLVQMIIRTAREQQLSAYELSLMAEKNHQAELEKALSEARLKLLESQVNPHFLFNTLNTIAQMSLMEGAETAAKLTYALAGMLRRSLSNHDNLISISDEITYIKDYIIIQTTRFPDKFQVEIDLTPEILKVRVPFMTLMILVENAIQHGFHNLRRPGRLIIKGDMQGTRAILEVLDNGVGMPQNVIASMEALQRSNSENTMHNGIGLVNIHRRLEQYFGNQASLSFEPLEPGTRVKIKIPSDCQKGDAVCTG